MVGRLLSPAACLAIDSSTASGARASKCRTKSSGCWASTASGASACSGKSFTLLVTITWAWGPRSSAPSYGRVSDSNRMCELKNAIFTSPTGPLRFLATMTSALFFSSSLSGS